MSHYSNRSHKSSMQFGDDLQVDYSYDQWRQAQMRQLEQNYARLNQRGAGTIEESRPRIAQAG